MATNKPTTLPLLYVTERHLDVGRAVAYRLARDTTSNGGDLVPGIPAIRVRRQWRVPTSRVEAVLGVVIDPADLDAWEAEQADKRAEQAEKRTGRARTAT